MTNVQLVLLASALSLIALLVWQKRARRRDQEIATLARAGGPIIVLPSKRAACPARQRAN